MPFAVFKVLIPFHRADLSPISMLHDLIFMDAVPFAVIEWANKSGRKAPSLMVRLETEHLLKDATSSSDYVYRRVIDQPQPRSVRA